MSLTDSSTSQSDSRSVIMVPSWRSILQIDQQHPFYFDHQLDHVPGILLMVEILRLIRQVMQTEAAESAVCSTGGKPGDDAWIRASFTFTRFCELDQETELRAWPSPRSRQWNFQAEQSQVPACVGTLFFLGSAPLAIRRKVAVYPAAPSTRVMPGYLVHRSRPENILVGEAHREEAGPVRCAVRSPGSVDHLFAALGGATRTPEELIEAARQATVMLWSYAYGWPADVKLTLNSVTADLPVCVDRNIPLELRWWPEEIKGNKARTSLELVTGSDRPQLMGLINIDSQGWSASQWQRIRAVRRREAELAEETE